MTSVGVGGLVSAVFAGPLKHATRHGLVMLGCVAVWGPFAAFQVRGMALRGTGTRSG
jgi:hypothetical protein